MADATFDAVIVGGGTNSLVTAIYLAKYGKMSVGVFEERHELGGGLGSHDAPAPGFIGNTHASTLRYWYYTPVRDDFPDFEEKGGKLAHYPVGRAIICKEDHSCFTNYHSEVDPTGEKTYRELVRFAGERDADTYMKIRREIREHLFQGLIEEACNLPPPPGQPTPKERVFHEYMKKPDCPIDRRWLGLSAYQAAHELFDHGGLLYMVLRELVAFACSADLSTGSNLLSQICFSSDLWFGVGGTHSIAHAYQRLLVENGGRFFTKSKVEKILIENGRAKGVRLADGTEIEARKVVVSGVDPHQLCFNLIGRDYLSDKILRKVAALLRYWTATITWYTWAMHEQPNYKAAAFNPDINNAHWTMLGCKDPDVLLREGLWRRLNVDPPEDAIVCWAHHSLVDPTQAPEGKHTLSTEELAVPAFAHTEEGWMKFKRDHADKTIQVLHEYAPNLTWDSVIGYDPITPFDVATRTKNMAPAGNFGVIDRVMGQNYPNVPITEFASYRLPIGGLYGTGTSWGNSGGTGLSWPGYTCYKAIADDLGLAKPWVDKGRTF
ncbi:MAG: NAD(P)/FAD-dependent oxidoreductase [Chloroflexi bacterium]|nr:NAD(P)/FAD-dependent oxidoreductase [Chloroflexota bacterium]